MAGTVAAQSPADATKSPRLNFPRDFASHPQSRNEWWYITGHGSSGTGSRSRDYGFQITFFRSRVEPTQQMASRFAARQLLFAHAAITDIQGKRFWHDQRIARAGFGIAQASEADTSVVLRDWSLERSNGMYVARIAAQDFAMQLSFSETQPLVLQGVNGLSRKGPEPQQASFYYSKPQLAFDGVIHIQGQRLPLVGAGGASANADFRPGDGAAWLDHEWSDSFMHPLAVGWDWIGMNLFDGSALTAFRLRDKSGAPLWDGGSYRHPGRVGAAASTFERGGTIFQALRFWKSSLTQATYPVEWLVRTPGGDYRARAVLDDQELDSRGSTGAVYWEGLCDLFDGTQRRVGRGYLEMTGYAKPLVL
ncbi:MAG: carotenoid 1,2-hydratase [Rhodoferax sp.]|nr:carotenoid 1,2-hydratase [Rhodoferax sp.]